MQHFFWFKETNNTTKNNLLIFVSPKIMLILTTLWKVWLTIKEEHWRGSWDLFSLFMYPRKAMSFHYNCFSLSFHFSRPFNLDQITRLKYFPQFSGVLQSGIKILLKNISVMIKCAYATAADLDYRPNYWRRWQIPQVLNFILQQCSVRLLTETMDL